MSSAAVAPTRRRSTISGSVFRVVLATILFTAGGMGLGLFLGIVGTVLFALLSGGKIDMTNAYRHVAIPLAILCGAVGLVGSTVLEVRSRRTSAHVSR